jgi:GDP-L-fucose synthase
MRPDYLFTGPLEPTSEAYAMAKLAGITYCRACRRQYGSSFIVAIPSTPFGPRDSLDADNAHVIGSLMIKFCRAKLQGADKVTLWGTGTPRRDFIYEPDLGRACIWLMERYDGDDPVNITGTEPISIAQLAEKISSIAEFRGQIVFDHSYPDGAPLKCLDGSKLFSTGWRPAWDFEDALRATFEEVRQCLTC